MGAPGVPSWNPQKRGAAQVCAAITPYSAASGIRPPSRLRETAVASV